MNASANNMKTRALFVLVMAFLVCFLLYPLWCVMEGALFSSGSYLTWNHLFMVFSNPIYQEGLWNSFLLAFSTTGLVLVLALPLAILADRFDFHGKRWLTKSRACSAGVAAVCRCNWFAPNSWSLWRFFESLVDRTGNSRSFITD